MKSVGWVLVSSIVAGGFFGLWQDSFAAGMFIACVGLTLCHALSRD